MAERFFLKEKVVVVDVPLEMVELLGVEFSTGPLCGTHKTSLRHINGKDFQVQEKLVSSRPCLYATRPLSFEEQLIEHYSQPNPLDLSSWETHGFFNAAPKCPLYLSGELACEKLGLARCQIRYRARALFDLPAEAMSKESYRLYCITRRMAKKEPPTSFSGCIFWLPNNIFKLKEE